jgi:hypothetical protein
MIFDRKKRLITDIESDLLDCLLASPRIHDSYNSVENLDTADYHIESDSNFTLENLSDAELHDRSQTFFTQLQSYWQNADAIESSIRN